MNVQIKPRQFTLFQYRDAVGECVNDGSLSAAPRRVLVVMAYKFMNAKRMEAFPSITTLAAWTSMRRQTVVDALRTLVDEGWLTVKRPGGPNRSTRYAPAIPPRYASETNDAAVDTDASVSQRTANGLPHGSDSLPDRSERTGTDTGTSEHAEHVNTAAFAAARESSRAAPPLSGEDLRAGIEGVLIGETASDGDELSFLLRVDDRERILRLRPTSELGMAIYRAYKATANETSTRIGVGDQLDIKAVGNTYEVSYTPRTELGATTDGSHSGVD